ncbi:hypothetical protein MRB53_016283 [Persea americana]|uniref:Uncharacterized protein n=1 Tax=Persea americana TaxID=3435 RepID=A0ACC2M1X7_PERAE|nr:hypothetical protein MRB53_016283 [Persea americana]
MRKPFPLRRNSISRGFWPFLFFCLLSVSNSHGLRKEGKDCPSSSCGPVVKITEPFRLKQYCGRPEPEFELTCEKNNTQALIHLPPRRYYVQEISYETKMIRLLDPALAASSSLPLYNSYPSLNYSLLSWPIWTPRRLCELFPTSERPIICSNCTMQLQLYWRTCLRHAWQFHLCFSTPHLLQGCDESPYNIRWNWKSY